MKIALSYRQDLHWGEPVPCYARSYHNAFEAMGHEVYNIYHMENPDTSMFDLYLELDNGRDQTGNLGFARHLRRGKTRTAVLFVDSHGQAEIHKLLAPKYDHVFFSVWDKREIFAGHTSATFCANATDSTYFNVDLVRDIDVEFDFGFFGSKTGLDRANEMIEICKVNGWTYDVRQVSGKFKVRWPATAQAMGRCYAGFNRGQKHDLNLRVFETMACGIPLICDYDPRNGMDQLFADWPDYTEWRERLCYEAYTFKGLEKAMLFAKNEKAHCNALALSASNYIAENHTIKNRAKQMLEVINAKA